MTRDLVGAAIEIAIGENPTLDDHRIIRGEARARVFEQVIEPLALFPADGIVGVLPGDDLGRTEAAADRSDHLAQFGPQLRRLAQLDHRYTGASPRAQVSDIGRS